MYWYVNIALTILTYLYIILNKIYFLINLIFTIVAFIWLSVTHIKLSAVMLERYLLIVSKFVIEDIHLFANSLSANDCNLKKIKLKLKSKNFIKKLFT